VSTPEPRLENLSAHEARRVRLTLACRDTDSIEKVDGAGEVVEVGGRRLQRMHNGVLVEEGCYQGAWMTELIRCLRGHHEPQEELAFHHVLERIALTEVEPVMIELGAWWTYYGMWFGSRIPGARLVALEPDPLYLEVGRRNVDLNDMTGIATFVHGAIGSGEAEHSSFMVERTGETLELPTHDLRSLMDASGLERVALVLADIQGAETALLEGARQVFAAGRVRFVIVSTHHHSISGSALTHQDTREALASCGAHLIVEHSVGESFSGDGLVVASFDDRDHDMRIEVSRARHVDSLFGELEYDLDQATRAAEDAVGRLAAFESDGRSREGSRWARVARGARGARTPEA